MSSKERNSTHELLRIFAMFLIVWYHIVSYYLYLISHDATYDNIIEATIPSLHIGVILFLLITGYYGIKPSISGILRLLIIVMVYFLPLQFVDLALSDNITNPRKVAHALLFLTNTPYWFVRTYIFLYLISPILNTFIRNSSGKELLLMMLVLGIISSYFGSMQGDPSLADGKNVCNFTFIYLLGQCLHIYQPNLERLKKSTLLAVIIILNTLLITSMAYFQRETFIGEHIWQWSFPYCSPLLIINAVLVFLLFTKFHFHSAIINSIGASTFAVYLLHCHPVIHKYIIMRSVNYITTTSVPLLTFPLIALSILFVCVGIDKILSPVWKIGQSFGKWIELKIR